MAMRRYKKRSTGADTAPLSAAAHATERQDTADAVKPAPLPPAANAVPLESTTPSPTSSDDLLSLKAQLDLLRQAGQQRQAGSQGASAATAAPHPSADAERIASLASNPIEAQIDAIPELSLAKKSYLRQRPFALSRPDLLRDAHVAALQLGLPDDSLPYFQFMDAALMHFGNFGFTSPPPQTAPTTETPTPIPTPAPAPMPQAPDHDGSYAPHIASAPPSRSEYAGSMPAPGASGRVTLSAEERQVAAATGISEVEYAKNKLKLLQMKKAGLIRD